MCVSFCNIGWECTEISYDEVGGACLGFCQRLLRVLEKRITAPLVTRSSRAITRTLRAPPLTSRAPSLTSARTSSPSRKPYGCLQHALNASSTVVPGFSITQLPCHGTPAGSRGVYRRAGVGSPAAPHESWSVTTNAYVGSRKPTAALTAACTLSSRCQSLSSA